MKKTLFLRLLLPFLIVQITSGIQFGGIQIGSGLSVTQNCTNGKCVTIINGKEYPCDGQCKVVVIGDTAYINGRAITDFNDNANGYFGSSNGFSIGTYMKMAITPPIGWAVFSKLHKNAQANKFPFKNIKVSPSWKMVLKGAKIGCGAITAMEIGALTAGIYTLHKIYSEK